MRRTVVAWVAVGLIVTGACVSSDGEEAVDTRTTSTTVEEGSSPTTTSTTSGGGSEGDVALGDECDGEPPIWALKGVRSPDGPEGPAVDPAVDEDDEQLSLPVDDIEDPGGSAGSDDIEDPGGSGDFEDTGGSGSSDDSGDPDSEDGSSGSSDECEPVSEPELGTGDVQITLRWESDADLDLHVVEPSGEEISYSDRGPTATGGQLDVDSNVGCENDGSVENVFWPPGDMPLGEYRVSVVGFTVDGCGGGDYTLTVNVQGEEVLNETGSVEDGGEDTYEFEA